MNKKIKVLSLFLVSMMVLLSGCGPKSPVTSTETSATEKPVELVMAFPNPVQIPRDMGLVEDEINKILLSKINATVKILPVDRASWSNQLNLMLVGGEKLDLLYTGTEFDFTGQVAKGQLLPIDKLVDQYGQDMKKTLDPSWWKAGMVKGNLYAIPVNQGYVMELGIMMRKDLVDKYKIDFANLKSLDDFDSVLKTIKDKEPGIVPITPRFIGGTLAEAFPFYDPLTDKLGVLPGNDNNLKVVNLYEMPEYADLVKKMRSWYNAGYIQQDVLASNTMGVDLIKSKKAFAMESPNIPGSAPIQFVPPLGMEMAFSKTNEAVATTRDVAANMMSISSTSKNPEKAMAFMNLLYTDKEIVNLLDNGIEGKHYVKKSENTTDFPPGVTPDNSGYFPMWAYLFGNQFLGYLPSAMDPNFWNIMQKANAEGKKSKAFGFSFNADSVKSEVAAVNNVVKQYKAGLENGAVDPDKVLPEFISKLKASGIDKIIAEKQKQLDEWAKINK